VSCRDWRLPVEAADSKTHWRTRQGQCGHCQSADRATIEKCPRDCATVWERSGHVVYGLKELGRRDGPRWLAACASLTRYDT
jgi:hypothetical protein